MGMDYTYAGSASYPRFNSELKGIVELFGGRMTCDRKPQEQCTMVEYFMEKPLTYEMPEGTPEIVVKWVNDPYDTYLYEDMKAIYDFLQQKWEDVERISWQIAEEVSLVVKYRDCWNIN